MESYNVLLTQNALDHLEEIILTIAKKSVETAQMWLSGFMEKINELAQNPHIGISFPLKTMTTSAFRLVFFDEYLLLYELLRAELQVVILQVLNAKRHYPHLYSNYEAALAHAVARPGPLANAQTPGKRS